MPKKCFELQRCRHFVSFTHSTPFMSFQYVAASNKSLCKLWSLFSFAHFKYFALASGTSRTALTTHTFAHLTLFQPLFSYSAIELTHRDHETISPISFHRGELYLTAVAFVIFDYKFAQSFSLSYCAQHVLHFRQAKNIKFCENFQIQNFWCEIWSMTKVRNIISKGNRKKFLISKIKESNRYDHREHRLYII